MQSSLGAVQKQRRVMRAERPLVTPAPRCERALLRARAVSPAGITTQESKLWFQCTTPARGWDGAPLWGWACRANVKADRHPGGQSTHPLSGGGSDKHRGQRLIEAASDRSFAFLTAEFGFCIKPQPTTAISVQWGFHGAGTRGRFCA